MRKTYAPQNGTYNPSVKILFYFFHLNKNSILLMEFTT